ncbi:TetR/AcrR family transcriptional regulator [Streptomyces sp. NPDC088354]|uniref:TetR/AcrR family transcriptional regulator n=1 Tax=unclassified Streptomyces TaxID=2593676 RepID=UPI0029AA0060|nr:TetR/AcrR family transcriptional regulator [Streptomyces sp. MI02-7b]MDX3071771.1 TetR/AcrR family transcriptional regulator [Streptomyces sp. MI02-7b]
MLTPESTPTRQRILDAADRLMRTIGLARTTTKEIAKAAGCSEAALYKHFANKEELFVHVLAERAPRLGPLMAELTADPGGRSVESCLADIARTAVLFYESSVPIAASLFAEPALLARHREALRPLDRGPVVPLRALSRYLRAERAGGRIRADADTDAAAALLLGACYQRGFLNCYLGEPVDDQPLEEFAAAIARTVLSGIAPDQ